MITSTSNQQMKNLTSLMKKSKERKNQNAFVVEGHKMVFEAPRERVKAIYVAESFLQDSTKNENSGFGRYFLLAFCWDGPYNKTCVMLI